MGKGAPRLTDESIGKAVLLLDGWTGKLTWARYLAVLETEIGHRYSKVAMHKHARIKAAWELTRKRLSDSDGEADIKSHGDAAVAQLRRKVSELRVAKARLEQENRDLLERFRLWSYNAVQKGCSESDLNRPLPVLRGR